MQALYTSYFQSFEKISLFLYKYRGLQSTIVNIFFALRDMDMSSKHKMFNINHGVGRRPFQLRVQVRMLFYTSNINIHITTCEVVYKLKEHVRYVNWDSLIGHVLWVLNTTCQVNNVVQMLTIILLTKFYHMMTRNFKTHIWF